MKDYSFIKKGVSVKWNDPAGQTSGIYQVYEIRSEEESITADDIILIGNGYSEAEVYAHELDEIPEDKIVAFHVGRGGRFHNQGHKSFMPHVNRLSDCFTNDSFIMEKNSEGDTLPDEEWLLCDNGGNVILKGRDNIESETGILDWDGEYDTDIIKYVSECDENELRLLLQAYEKQELDEDILVAVMYHWPNMVRVVDEENNTLYLGMNSSRIFEEAGLEDAVKVMADDDFIIWEKESGMDKLKKILKYY